ncbi:MULTISPECIES: DUF2798 domain-containing protein [Marinobacter]|uniref:DUF2798 domain-containing protein n=1 Tax=Marinobacter xestospongiae TaxID=994319 RepID=A0ABU3VUX3_9GAMM|nr:MULTISPECIES: DUF2798 domain-containing protein [Marinobacter]MCG8517812.1 DUF2798 domain-containing protein [Pseudomonadales bacterium]MCK7565501.1 DUF2798 domain-containing protein [Marinobacter xestospongiae]MDV2077960.1 DUF2798 domain-containing protein [Marinobacter xestospongiae]UDL06356.1 DUF2798 domain-containing protein [Marinobacter sp. CA1]
MSAKYRFFFSLLMSLVLSGLMTAWVTWINLGLVEGFVVKWATAFVTAWPAAALISFAFGPRIHQLTHWLTNR